MAEAKVVDKVEDIITCSLCREILNEPKTFICLHSFCKGCVDSLERVNDPSVEDKAKESKQQEEKEACQGYNCPLCRRFTPITDVRSVHIIAQLLDAYHASKQPQLIQKCNTCTTNAAKWYCPDCKNGNLLCDTCKPFHDRFTEHQVTTVEDFKSGNYVMEKAVYCELHPTYKLEMFCIECQNIACVMCKILKHDGHKAEPISDAVQRILPKLNEDVEQIKENIQKDKEEVKRLNEEKKAINKKLDMEIQDVEDKVSEATQVIKWVETTTGKTQGVNLLKELQEGLLSKVANVAYGTSANMHSSKCYPWSFDNIPNVLTKTIQLPNPGGNYPFTRISILWNKIAAFCHPTAQIHLVDFDGNQSGVLQLDGKVGKPRTAVQVREKEAILAASSGLFQIDENGKVMSTLANGDFSDVCCGQTDGKVYALEHNEGIIRSFKRAQDHWREDADIVLQNYKNEPTNNGQNYLFSFTIFENTICLARTLNHRIVFYDMRGNKTRSMPNVSHPSVCGINSNGHAIFTNWGGLSINKAEADGTNKTLFKHGNQVWYAAFPDEQTLWLIERSGKLIQYKRQ